MISVLRQAQRSDIAGMHRVRLAVRENVLDSPDVTEVAYVPAIESTGRGWVVEEDDCVVGFAVANRETGNIWALFVHPDHEGLGHGRALHDAMMTWLFSTGVERAWLSTEPGTRAQRFYARAGWSFTGMLSSGEAGYACMRPAAG